MSNRTDPIVSPALYTDDKEILGRSIIGVEEQNSTDDWHTFFELSRCVDWIRRLALKNVALQFPDSLMPKSALVAMEIEKIVNQRISILGDTTFGECCVDEVAAEHIGADGVIHFGNACLAPTRRLPVMHVFTKKTLHLDALLHEIETRFGSEPIHLAIFYDVCFHHSLSDFKIDFENVTWILCKPDVDGQNVNIKCGRICNEDIDTRWSILYIGENYNYLFLLALNFPNSNILTFNSSIDKIEETGSRLKRELMRRHYLIEKAKDSSRIGVLVGTLAVSRFGNIIDYILKIIKESGKKPYTFLVGKPNVPKLANFSEIDIFVIVACPETSIIDCKDYFVPIITPFELDVALNKNRTWDGSYATSYSEILPQGRQFVPFEGDNEADISLISGRLRGATTLGPANLSSALSAQETTLSVLHANGGGEFLSSRSWQGLEQKLGETPVQDAVEGRIGIAAGYDGEGQDS